MKYYIEGSSLVELPHCTVEAGALTFLLPAGLQMKEQLWIIGGNTRYWVVFSRFATATPGEKMVGAIMQTTTLTPEQFAELSARHPGRL